MCVCVMMRRPARSTRRGSSAASDVDKGQEHACSAHACSAHACPAHACSPATAVRIRVGELFAPKATPAWIRTRVARFKVWSANHYTTGAPLRCCRRVRSSVVEHSAAVRMVPGSNPGVPSVCLHTGQGKCPVRPNQNSPTRIRTAVAGFRVLSANHYTMGDALEKHPWQDSNLQPPDPWSAGAQMVAEVGFDPTTCGLWAHRADHCASAAAGPPPPTSSGYVAQWCNWRLFLRGVVTGGYS